jgi:K+-sensing histidine kinase KdpD
MTTRASSDSALPLMGAFVAYLVVTAALHAFREDVPSFVPFAIILAICVVTSWNVGPLSGVYAGFIGALFFNFFFTEPYDTILIDDVSDRILAATLLVSGLAASGIGRLYRRRSQR